MKFSETWSQMNPTNLICLRWCWPCRSELLGHPRDRAFWGLPASQVGREMSALGFCLQRCNWYKLQRSGMWDLWLQQLSYTWRLVAGIIISFQAVLFKTWTRLRILCGDRSTKFHSDSSLTHCFRQARPGSMVWEAAEEQWIWQIQPSPSTGSPAVPWWWKWCEMWGTIWQIQIEPSDRSQN